MKGWEVIISYEWDDHVNNAQRILHNRCKRRLWIIHIVKLQVAKDVTSSLKMSQTLARPVSVKWSLICPRNLKGMCLCTMGFPTFIRFVISLMWMAIIFYSAINSTRITQYFQPIKTFRTSKQKICSQGIFRPITEEAE